MDPLWGTTGTGAWDGGVFGNISWAIAMLSGTLAYDLLVARPPARAAGWMLISGALLMLLGYGLSCLSTLYTVEPGSEPIAEGHSQTRQYCLHSKKSSLVVFRIAGESPLRFRHLRQPSENTAIG